MIATVDGRVLARGTDSIVVGLGGLGIKVFVPVDLLTAARPGDEIFLHTYLHVREQELALYGFAGEQDLAMFHLLLGVSGIGPKSALSILSAMPVDALHLAIGQDALHRASKYAAERVVFGRPIGQNQGIQHPLAERWMALEAAWAMVMKGAWLYDQQRPCGAEANAAKFLGARAGYESCQQAVLTHGGFGYAKEYHVERLLREVMITRVAPVSEQMILSFIAEKVLGLPKSY